MNKSIISKLTFNDLDYNTRIPNGYIDNNIYSKLKWDSNNTPTVINSNNIKVMQIKTNTDRIHITQAFTNSASIIDSEWEVEANIKILTLNSYNGYFGWTNQHGKYLGIYIRNSFKGGLSLTSTGGKEVSFNYKFEANKEYNIIVSYIAYNFRLIINGEHIGVIDGKEFIKSLSSTNTLLMMFGSADGSSTDAMTNGLLWNMNVSLGGGVKNEDPSNLTKYGSNLLSRLNFDNLAILGTANISVAGLESVMNSAVTWNYDSTKINNYTVNTTFTTNINNNFTANIKFSNNRNRKDVDLITYGNYKVTYNYIPIGEPEPIVVVDSYTKSALDFENGLVDKIPTTVWNKEGSASVTTANKLFGESSFETKALGDSLYTNSNVITGGSTPFTIEFYALIKDRYGHTEYDAPLISQSKSVASGEQQLNWGRTIRNVYFYKSDNNTPSLSPVVGKYKFNYNEINKYTLTYDSSALRVFINDKLDSVNGTLYGWNKTDNPIRLLDSLVPTFESFRHGTKGLIDNINIHDGIATKVRDYDPYEEYLIVDLAFDGENNSTKIVDNGSGEAIWSVMGSAKLSTTNKFDGFSSLYLASNTDYIQTSKNNFNFTNDDFTLSFKIMKTTDQKWNVILSNATLDEININTLIAIGSSNSGDNRANKLYCIGNSVNGSRHTYISEAQILANKEYKIDIIVKNNTLYYYINDILDKSFTYNNDFDFTKVLSNYIYLGYCSWNSPDSFNGYIKNFKVYKGVAVIPKSPVGKIQLDFNNNFNDKYNNSTWANNGVTFDQLNSVKGYAAYFNGAYKYIQQSNYTFDDSNIWLLFDMKKTSTLNDRILISNDLAYSLSLNNEGYISLNNKMTTNSSITLNNYYQHEYIGKNNLCLYKLNDVIVGQSNNNESRLWDGFSIGSTSGGLNGYIDNFKSIKDYQEPVIIDKPAIHLPLETNAVNIGYSNLIINSDGSPTYTTVEGKKYIKFEVGKHITINNNNIFNIGLNSDYYIETDIIIYGWQITDNRVYLISSADSDKMGIRINETTKKLEIRINSTNYIINDLDFNLNEKYNIKIFRSNGILTTIINDKYKNTYNDVYEINFDQQIIHIGGTISYKNTASLMYMSNFKMFVGTSEIPETYNDKKVLDLTFEPTRKSYLFKDKNNKCIIHPVNITQRDYQDSQYCCTFNGTNQYLELGKNDLFNFGLDDFVIEIKFKVNSLNKTQPLLANAITSVAGRIFICTTNTNQFQFGYGLPSGASNMMLTGGNVVVNTIYNMTITRINNKFTLYVDSVVLGENSTTDEINLNGNNNTWIGNIMNSDFLDGTIYSLKVLRNTTDLTLLDEVASKFEESFTLSNGTDSQTILNDVKKDSHNIRFIKDTDKSKLIIDGEFIEVPSVENTSNELKLFDNYNSDVNDVKLYNTAFVDEDIFLGSKPLDTQFGEIEYYEESMYELEIPEGDYTLSGFIEGYIDREFFIYNTFLNYEIFRGTEYYDINGMNKYSLDDYEINDLVSGEKYKVLTHEMIKGFISGTVNLKNCGVTSNDMEVFCYRSDNYRHIGTYSVDKDGKYVIPNLDVNSRYDIIFRDKTKKIKDQISNYRKPMKY